MENASRDLPRNDVEGNAMTPPSWVQQKSRFKYRSHAEVIEAESRV